MQDCVDCGCGCGDAQCFCACTCCDSSLSLSPRVASSNLVSCLIPRSPLQTLSPPHTAPKRGKRGINEVRAALHVAIAELKKCVQKADEILLQLGEVLPLSDSSEDDDDDNDDGTGCNQFNCAPVKMPYQKTVTKRRRF
jgi:hypothetical protein